MLLVVAYHLRAPLVGAGFVGVDVFFVISGYLITGILLTETERSGSINLSRFYTRRVRRLLPASSLTLVAVLVATLALLSPLIWVDIAQSALAAALYGANVFFGLESGDYLARDLDSNPLLHYWSLAVEEQFYLVWPLVISLLARRSSRVRVAVFVVLLVASFAHSQLLVEAGSVWAYYSPFSRAWEFAAGALLAIALPVGLRSTSSVMRAGLAVVGVATISLSAVLLSASTPFPGVAAIPVVVGTMAVLAARVTDGPVGWLLDCWPAQMIGKLSYSWYLWHLPFIVFAEALFGSAASVRLLAAAISLVVAYGSYHLVEQPIRVAPVLTGSLRPNVVLGVVGSLATAAIAFGVVQYASATLEEPEYVALVETREAVEATYGRPCNSADLDVLAEHCTFGGDGDGDGDDDDDRPTVLLVGDSHASQWLPALRVAAEAGEFTLVVRAEGGCNVAGLRAVFNPAGCEAFQQTMPAVLDDLQPEVVIVGQTSQYLEVYAADEWAAGTEAFFSEAEAAGARVLWLNDPPQLDADPIDCLAMSSAEECAEPADAALRGPHLQAEVMAPVLSRDESRSSFDPAPQLCPQTDSTCPLLDGDIILYRDNDHVSLAAARRSSVELLNALQLGDQ